MKFLVTATNGDIGEAIGRILKERWPDAELHGTDLSSPWIAGETFDHFHRIPRGDDPGYVTALAALSRAIAPDAVFPVSEPELLALASVSPGVTDMPLVMAPVPVILRFSDKLKTAQWLRERGIPAPHTKRLTDARASDLPVFVKPAHGHGGRGGQIVRSADHLAFVQRTLGEDYVAQTLLEPDDQEYTCAVVRLGGQVRTLVMRRQMDGSNTVRIEVVDRPSVAALLERFAAEAELEGSVNVQLRITDSGPQIFEINPRFSGTVMMRHRLGFSDLLWTLAARKGEPPPRYEPPVGARVFRLSREVVMPPSPDPAPVGE